MRLRKNDPAGNYWYDADGVAPASPVLSDGYSAFTPGISEINGSGSRFYLADAQGNSRGLLDGGQNNPDGYNWDAFGNSVSRLGANPTAYAWNEESGYQTDNDSGLKLLGHRYYDSRTGRFLSQDPAGDGDNWYAHADNDPMDEVDPEGLMSAPTGAGMWGVNGGDQTDANWIVGNIEADSGSARNIWNETNHIWIVNFSPGVKAGAGQDGYNTGSGIDQVNWAVPGWSQGITGSSKPQQPQHEGLGHYLIRQFLSGGQADGSHLGPPSAGTFGKSPNVAKNQVNTSAPGGRAAAKSLFRKLSKGKKVINSTARDGSIRRYTEDGSVQIRMKSNGATNVDIQTATGKEDVHF